MAISQENEKIAEIYIKSAETSLLSLEEQAAWTELINSCKIATNGLSQHEKIQKMSENTLRMVGRMLYDRVETVKANKEIRELNSRINENVNKKFDELNDVTSTFEKKMDEKISTIEGKITVLADHLLENSKDTYKLVGKEEENKKTNEGWLKTLLTGLDNLKWAIVTLGGIAIIATAFQPQVAEGIEHILKLFTGGN